VKNRIETKRLVSPKIKMKTTAKILIVDDEEPIRNLLEEMLEHQREGYEVIMTDNAVEGLNLTKEQEPDVILLDRMMPGMTGDEFIKKLRNSPKIREIQVIFVSARVSEDDKIKGLGLTADAYICKPFNFEELLLTIDTCVARAKEYKRVVKANIALSKMVRKKSEEAIRNIRTGYNKKGRRGNN